MKPKREYFKAIPAAYVVFEHSGKILLLKRISNYFNDYFSLPAGHVEQGESVKAAAICEAREEVGVKILPQDLRLAHFLSRPAVEKNGDTRIDFFFATSKWTGAIKNMEPDKCSALEWHSPETLPENMVPEVRQAIESIAGGIIDSEFDWDKT